MFKPRNKNIGLQRLTIRTLSEDVNPIQDGPFRGCSRMGGKKASLLKICHTYPIMIKLGIIIPHLKKFQKYVNHVSHPLSSADISIFFTGNLQILL